MKRENIEKAAFAQREKLERNAHPHEVMAFAIQQINMALDEAADEANSHSCQTYAELCDCRDYIGKSIRALKIP